jgi:hypothetical protein
MKICYFIIIAFGGLLTSTAAFSQNIQTATIEWNCTSTFTARPGITSDEITKVVSSSDQIVWYDNEGVIKKTFSVTDTNGSWTNVSNNGTINFTVASGDDAGMIQFLRTDGVARIRIHVITDDDSQIYELSVANFQTL